MALLKVTKEQKAALSVATIIALIVGVVFLQNYIILILVAAIVAYLFNPIYVWLIKHKRTPGQAATLTFLATLLAIIIPLLFVVSVTVIQIDNLVNDIDVPSTGSSLNSSLNNAVNDINYLLDKLGIDYSLSVSQITDWLSATIEQFGKAIASGLVSSVSGIFSFITVAIIYIYVFMSLLVNKEKLQSSLSKLNPLGTEISELYFERMGAMTKATVRGQFIIALCQGLESAAILAVAGLPNLFFFFALLLTVMSVIPLGAGIITIPIGIAMILMGNVSGGILVIANHLLIVTNIDNIMRPRLVPKEARLDAALMMLSVFSGLAFFGFVGIVLGPVLMIVIVTTLQMFMEVFRDTESLSKAGAKTNQKSIFSKIKNIVSGK